MGRSRREAEAGGQRAQFVPLERDPARGLIRRVPYAAPCSWLRARGDAAKRCAAKNGGANGPETRCGAALNRGVGPTPVTIGEGGGGPAPEARLRKLAPKSVRTTGTYVYGAVAASRLEGQRRVKAVAGSGGGGGGPTPQAMPRECGIVDRGRR